MVRRLSLNLRVAERPGDRYLFSPPGMFPPSGRQPVSKTGTVTERSGVRLLRHPPWKVRHGRASLVGSEVRVTPLRVRLTHLPPRRFRLMAGRGFFRPNAGVRFP